MTNDHPEPTSPGEWRDRLVDRALEEVAGGESPPDLAEQILAARAAGASDLSTLSSSGELAMATETSAESSARGTRLRTLALAASLLLNFGLAAWLIGEGARNEPPVALVDQTASIAREHERKQLTDRYAEVEQIREELRRHHDSTRSLPLASNPPAGGSEVDVLQSQVTADTWTESSDPANARYANDFYQRLYLGEEGQGQPAEGVAGPNQPPTSLATLNPSDPSTLDGAELYSFYSRVDMERSSGRVSLGYHFGDSDSLVRRWRENGGDQFQGDPKGLGIGPGAAGDQYSRIVENPFKLALGEQAISTFSIDVDTASYANVRQMLQSNVFPPADAVRLEEFVNYFTYDAKYSDFVSDLPGGDPTIIDKAEDQLYVEPVPFAAQVEVTGCPWEPKHRLVKVGVFGREMDPKERPKSNLVFLVDVSGSMDSPEKLPLVVHGMQQLAKELGENDKVAIVVYASSEGLVLPSTPGTEKETILGALGNLSAGGSTAGGAGITLAYQIAQDNFIEGGTNRVILCTDGDFNVGVTAEGELERMVEQKAKDSKVFLSVIGFGRGNLNDSMMEKITGIGNGNYYYVDGEREAERVFVKGMTGMLVTIAKDVKIQIEFNPNKVAGYRLLGYENRMLRTEDFNDDTKDAGEIGAGHRVTALYEIVPAGEPVKVAESDDFKYQRPPGLTPEAETAEMLTLKMRYKEPESDTSQKLEWTATDPGKEYGQASADTRFAAAVAGFGMLLRDSQYKGNLTFDAVHELASAAVGSDPDGERSEFLTLVETAKRLKGEIDAAKKAEEEAAKATPQPAGTEPTSSADAPGDAPRVQDATPVAPK